MHIFMYSEIRNFWQIILKHNFNLHYTITAHLNGFFDKSVQIDCSWFVIFIGIMSSNNDNGARAHNIYSDRIVDGVSVVDSKNVRWFRFLVLISGILHWVDASSTIRNNVNSHNSLNLFELKRIFLNSDTIHDDGRTVTESIVLFE